MRVSSLYRRANMIKLIEEKRDSLQAICLRFGVCHLELFGSAARGDFNLEDSDVDFLVEFEAPEDGDYFSQFFGLKEALEELFGRPVDLVKTSAITNPYFLKSVALSRSTVYAA